MRLRSKKSPGKQGNRDVPATVRASLVLEIGFAMGKRYKSLIYCATIARACVESRARANGSGRARYKVSADNSRRRTACRSRSDLALYIASSALWRSPSLVVPESGYAATPMLAEISIVNRSIG
jgi:hypothetical protein